MRIFSPLNKKSCLDNTIEVIKRIFLSFVCLLIAIPAALLIPIGLPIKAIAKLCRPCTVATKPEDRFPSFKPPPTIPPEISQEPETPGKNDSNSSSTLSSVTSSLIPIPTEPSKEPEIPGKNDPNSSSNLSSATSSLIPTDSSHPADMSTDPQLVIDNPSPKPSQNATSTKSQTNLFEVSSEHFTIKPIMPDGNCAFYAFQQSCVRAGIFSENNIPSCAELRKKVVGWIREQLESQKPHVDFWLHLEGTVVDFYQLKLTRLQAKAEETEKLATNEETMARLSKIRSKLVQLEIDLDLLKEKKEGYKKRIEAYLQAFELNDPLNKNKQVDLNKRIHTSQSEFLALSQLYSVNIRLYTNKADEAKEKYILVQIHSSSKQESKNIDFLYKDNHIDLLIVPTDKEKNELIQAHLNEAENYVKGNQFDKAEKILDLNLMKEFKSKPIFWDVEKKSLENEKDSPDLFLYAKVRELERFIDDVKKIKKRCSPQAATERSEALENEIQVPDDGNCLFHSVIEGLKLLKSVDQAIENHEFLRTQTAQWIFDNYARDSDFKNYAHLSFFAHYNDQKNALELEKRNFLEILNISGSENEVKPLLQQTEDRLKTVDTFNTYCLNLLGCEGVEKPSIEIDYILKDYTDMIKIPKKLASQGEMYALSKLLDVHLELYDGNQKLRQVFQPKTEVPRGTIRIVHLRNHYVCMQPPAEAPIPPQ